MKLFAFDIDGTFITRSHEISKSTLDVLASIERNGDKWCLVTGRNHDIVKPLLKKYNLNCDLILNNGHQYINMDGVEIIKIPMTGNVLKNVLNILLDCEFHISAHADLTKFIFLDPESYFERHMELARKKNNSDLTHLNHSPLFNKEMFIHNVTQVKSVEEIINHDAQVLKIDARNFDKEMIKEAYKRLDQIDEIAIHSSFEAFVEITERSSNKATMLQAVATDLGIRHSDVFVFGDSMNDLELFQQFENSIAMGNAKPQILELAKWVTASNNDDGIFHFMNANGFF